MKTVYLILKGRVQGVGFRYFTYEKAMEYKIKGTVKNNDNGSVEVYAQGEEVNLNQFIDTIKKGPSFSFVSEFKIEVLEKDNFSTFQIVG